MRKILPFLLFLFALNAVHGQDFSNKGKDFWLAYGNHVRMFNSGEPEKMQLYITSDVATSGTVSITGISVSIPFTVTANQITTLDIPRTAALMDEGIYDNGIHVKAGQPVVVYSFIYVNSISGATLCLPTNTLGKDYYSINYDQESNEKNSYSYFFVVATDTGITSVQIIPSAGTKAGRLAGAPFTVNLRQGQVYQVLSLSDLTGSSIRSISNGSSCKRIAVFCGSGKISIGCGNPNSSDNLYQQMYPVSTWGKTYITTPSINAPTLKSQYNYYRIFKSEPSAVVKVNGSVIPANAFMNNQYADLPPSNEPNYIESDKPILVAQYFSTQGCAGNNSGQGDPEMIYLNPLEQTISTVTLNAMQPSVNTNINQHYINVVLKNKPEIINSFTIDGMISGNFTALPSNPLYAYAQIPVSRGAHTLHADSGFNAISYGFGGTESYGYSAGTNLKDLYQFVSIHNRFATVNIPAGCRASPFRFSMTFPYKPVKLKWVFKGIFPDTTISDPVPDSSWVVNGRTLYRYSLKKDYIISKIGIYPITLIADNPTSDGCSGEQEINYDLQIFERPSADFTISTTGCINDSIKVTDIGNGNGRPVIKWNWDFGNANSNIPGPIHKYSQSGSYTIRFSTITDVGCVSDTVEKKVVLNEQGVARFIADAPACQNLPVRFTDRSLPAGKIKTWNWDFGDGSSSSEASPSHIYKDAKSYIVSLVVETNAGCKSEKQTLTIPVHFTPKANFITPEICLSDPLASFIDSTTIGGNPSPPLKYIWNFGDANASFGNPNQSTVKDATHKFTSVGVYDVRLTVTTADGCISDTLKKFTVNGAVPKAAFDISNAGSLCSNKEVVLINKSLVDFGNITRIEIYWDYANNPSDKTTDENPSPDKLYTHMYEEFGSPVSKDFQVLLVAYSGISCVSQVSRKITVSGTPKIDFSPFEAVCEEKNPFQIFNAKEIFQYPGTGRYTGAGVSAAGLFNPSQAKDGEHTIRYTFQAANGCSDTAEENIVVLPTPFTNAGPDKYILEGESAIIEGKAAANSSYLWLPQTAIEDNKLLNPKVTPVDDINYRLQVTSADGCTGTDEVKVVVLKKIKVPNIFSPNGDGINDTWKIEYLHAYPGATIEIYNRYGQQVFYSNGYSRNWDGNYLGKPLPAGTYYWLINPKNGRNEMKGSLTIIR